MHAKPTSLEEQHHEDMRILNEQLFMLHVALDEFATSLAAVNDYLTDPADWWKE